MTLEAKPTDKSYATDALDYVAAGWMGVLPVPPRRKDPLPAGYSGYNGKYPDREKIKSWIENGFNAKIEVTKNHFETMHFDAVDANLALRLPNFIIGIDVDAYDGKKGRECLAYAEQLWGELPPTVRSTSRLDGISGIRLYRVPVGTILQTGVVLQHPEKGRLDGIDILQYFHRYCMAWPSVHPDTGRRYRWVDPDGMMHYTDHPLLGSVVNLPEKWVDALSRPPEEELTAHEDAEAVVRTLTTGPMSKRVNDALRKSTEEILSATGGRHDEALRAIGRLLRLNHEGEPGVADAMRFLQDVFVAAIQDRASEYAATLEWDRMLYGNRIHDKIASTPSESVKQHSQLEAIMGPMLADQVPVSKSPQEENPNKINFSEAEIDDFIFGDDAEPSESQTQPNFASEADIDDFIFGDGFDENDRALAEGEGVVKAAQTWWGIKDTDQLWDLEDYEPEQATIGRREDGACLFYPGKVSALVGPPESAKSWVAQYVVSQEIMAGNTAMYLDFEDSDKGIIGRMRYLGVPPAVGRENFLYADPKGALTPEAARELFSNLDIHRPTVVIVDGLGAVMAMHNHEMKDNTEYIRFFQLLLEPLTRSGAAVIVIDHTSKDADETNNYAIGAQAKLQMITGVQIRVQAVKKFGRGKEGRLRLAINKDRPGGVREHSEFRVFKGANNRGSYELDYWATVFVDARDVPNVRITMRFEPKDLDGAPDGDSERRTIEEKITDFVSNCPTPPGVQEIINGVTGHNNDFIRQTIKEMVFSGRLKAESQGPGKKTLHYVVDLSLKDIEDDAAILGDED